MTTARLTTFSLLLLTVLDGLAQGKQATPSAIYGLPETALSEQTSRIVGLAPRVEKLRALQTKRPCESSPSPEEVLVRQELLESIQLAVLDVDSVLAELSSERGDLSDLRTKLQSRRDRTVAKLNTAALLTGAGLGAAVSATQFSALGTTAQNFGDGLGVGAGAASTILSLLAAHRQQGPKGTVGDIPNMLAPLFESAPVLHAFYPPEVLQYLQSVPTGEELGRGTRLEQLKARWVKVGRLDAPDASKRQQKIVAITSSENDKVHVSIDDLSDRIAMLGDVGGHVSLMKRDLAALMHSYTGRPIGCKLDPQ